MHGRNAAPEHEGAPCNNYREGRKLKALLVSALGLACVGFLVAARLTTLAGQAATMDVGMPGQDGTEIITIRYEPPGSSETVTVTAEVTLNGKPSGPGDAPQTTAKEKADKIIKAINDISAIDPIVASGTPVGNVVVVSIPADGEMKGLEKTNNTREKTTKAGDPDEDEIAQGSVTLSGAAAGVDMEGGPSRIDISIGDVDRSFTVFPGMSVTQLRRTIAEEFDAAGFRVSEIGTSVLIVLPADDPSFSFYLNDATLTASSGLSIF